MIAILLKCTECDETSEVYCDGDNAMMCPECRSVDSFTEPDEDEEEAPPPERPSGYNWDSVGPGGCDSHNVEHPCGHCHLKRRNCA